jgi:hypothetical protein
MDKLAKAQDVLEEALPLCRLPGDQAANYACQVDVLSETLRHETARDPVPGGGTPSKAKSTTRVKLETACEGLGRVPEELLSWASYQHRVAVCLAGVGESDRALARVDRILTKAEAWAQDPHRQLPAGTILLAVKTHTALSGDRQASLAAIARALAVVPDNEHAALADLGVLRCEQRLADVAARVKKPAGVAGADDEAKSWAANKDAFRADLDQALQHAQQSPSPGRDYETAKIREMDAKVHAFRFQHSTPGTRDDADISDAKQAVELFGKAIKHLEAVPKPYPDRANLNALCRSGAAVLEYQLSPIDSADRVDRLRHARELVKGIEESDFANKGDWAALKNLKGLLNPQ